MPYEAFVSHMGGDWAAHGLKVGVASRCAAPEVTRPWTSFKAVVGFRGGGAGAFQHGLF